MSKLNKSAQSISAVSTMSSITEPSTIATSSGMLGSGPSAASPHRPPLLRTLSDDSLTDTVGSPAGGRSTPSGLGGGAGGGGAGGGNAIISLSFPSAGGGGRGGGGGGRSGSTTSLISDPKACLSPLNDERSKYASVARSCLSLNQYAGSGSQCEGAGGGSGGGGKLILSSSLFHDGEYASVVSATISALSSCATSHSDRRCRILSLKTLSTFARSAFARIRHSNLLFSTREGMNVLSNIEDQVVNDVPSTLITVGLEDDDDGVSALAFECLGSLVLDASSDVLRDEIRSIACCCSNRRMSPSLGGGAGGENHHQQRMDEDDFEGAMSELRTRVLSRAIPPRIRRILHRVTLYRSTSHTSRTLSMVTEAICHMVASAPQTNGTVSRTSYAKRWYELDTENLAKELVEAVLLPCIADQWDGFGGGGRGGDGSGGSAGHIAAIAVLKICHACPSALWVTRACACAVESLLEVIYQMGGGGGGGGNDDDEGNNYGVTEGRAAILATILVALRGVPIDEGGLWGGWGECILNVIDEIRTLPCTVPIPAGIVSAGLVLDYDEDCLYDYDPSCFPGCIRQPVRIGLWSEVALSLFLEGNGSIAIGTVSNTSTSQSDDSSSSSRLEMLHYVVTGEIVSSILADRSGGKNKNKKKGDKRSGSAGTKNSSGGNEEHADLDGHFLGAGPAEELVLSFCSVAFIIGQTLLRHVTPGSVEPSRSEKGTTIVDREAEEWLRCSLVLLSAFSPCVNWKNGSSSSLPSSSSSSMESEVRFAHDEEEEDYSFASPYPRWTVCAAARTAYLTLLQQCLWCTGLLNPVSSVSLRLMLPHNDTGISFSNSGAVPPSPSSAAAAAAATMSAPLLGHHMFAQKDLSALADQLVEYKLREGVPSRSVRIRLLALLADHWVQRCQIQASNASKSAGRDGEKEDDMRASQINMNEMNAREILSMLAAEITALIEAEEKIDNSSDSVNSRGAVASSHSGPVGNMAYLQVCIACIESIALAAYEFGRRLGHRRGESHGAGIQDHGIQQTASNLRADIDEDSSYILSVSLAALNGQKKKSSKSKSSNESPASQLDGDNNAQRSASDGSEMASTTMISECLDAVKRIQAVVDPGPDAEKSMQGGSAISRYGGKAPAPIVIGSPTTGAGLSLSPLLSKTLVGGWMSIVGESGPPTDRNSRRLFSQAISSPRGSVTRAYESDATHESLNEWMSKSPFEDMTADAYDRAYMFHYYRQVVLARCDMAILSSPLACLNAGDESVRRCASPRLATNHGPGTPRGEGDGTTAGTTLVSARPRNALRLTPPLLPSSKSMKTSFSSAENSCWSDSVTAVTGASDPVSLTLAHAVKSCPRYDGETERRLAVSLRMYNVTAVPITNGVRLDLGIVHSAEDGDDGDGIEMCTTQQLTSTTVLYKSQIKPGDHLTWEVILGNWPTGRIQLRASVTFREMETETSTHRWIGLPASSLITTGGAMLSNVSEGNEGDNLSKEDFSAEQESSGDAPFGSVEDTADEEDETTDMTLSGEDVPISPFVMLQPCPLVFFRDNCGDQTSFWFLWFSMLSPVEEIKLASRESAIAERDDTDPVAKMSARYISDMSLLVLRSQGMTNETLKGWAFMTLCGRRVLCLLSRSAKRPTSIEEEDQEEEPIATLSIKSDDLDLINTMVGSISARRHFVSNITGGVFALYHI